MKKQLCGYLAMAMTIALGTGAPANATVPYGSLSGGSPGGLGPILATPSVIPGKEYSHDLDEETLAPGGFADPQQVIAWDGSGGVGDGLDFTGERPSYTPDDQVDAIANHGDHLFRQLQSGGDTVDTAHLIFSHDDMISIHTAPLGGGALPAPFLVPSGTPPGIMLSSGKVIGGAGELSYEKAFAFSPPSDQGLWAKQADINAMPFPGDVDGVELWGPEPAFTADTDKYSLDLDFMSGTSVWNGITGTPYISHATIVAAVTSLLGPVSGVLPFPDFIDGNDAINLDALMVQDIIPGNAHDTFDRDPTGAPGDKIIFSIRQIVDPSDPTGYYATGSELFVLDATTGPAGTTFLAHGGHLWDKAYALSDLSLPTTLVNGHAVIDINAIEAISQGVVPEPTSAALFLVAGMGLVLTVRRRC
ncbi:MAG: PEP-CTERM sorting domain-containing protein [Pirellulales bacterium]